MLFLVGIALGWMPTTTLHNIIETIMTSKNVRKKKKLDQTHTPDLDRH